MFLIPLRKTGSEIKLYIKTKLTNLPPVVTKKEVLCSGHIQLHLASHHISHIHTKTGPFGDFQLSTNLTKLLPPQKQSVLPLLPHWNNIQVQADTAEYTS